MGTMLIDNLRPAVALRQDLEHALNVGASAAGRKLAVAEGARASLAEEIVTLRVQRPVLIEPAHVGDPILDGPAPLKDQRPIAVLSQEIPGDQAGRSRADNHGPIPQ